MEFTKEQHDKLRCSRLKQPNMKELVRVGIDRCKQAVMLSIGANHRFVDRDQIRIDGTVEL